MDKKNTTVGCDKESSAVLQAVYKCGKMGTESGISILKRVKDDEMRRDMTEIIDGYQKICATSSEKLMKMGVTPEDSDLLVKAGSKIGMAVNTMIDSTSSHLAEMVIQGANMGITDLQGSLNRYRDSSCSSEALKEAENGIKFNQQVVEDMKKYL